MDLDLSHVRAFVAAADHRHFGRAAASLFLTQQALSKRIQRLEQSLGEPLFLRHHTGVELAASGRLFLGHARKLLVAADDASIALRLRPLKLDVWGQIHAPMRFVRTLPAVLPDLNVELSMRRSLDAAVAAILRQEIDAAFGRPYDLAHPLPSTLARHLFHLEPLVVAVHDTHPYAARTQLTPQDLRTTGLWWPLDNSPPEMAGWFTRYTDAHGIPADTDGLNLGLDAFLTALHDNPGRVALAGVNWAIPNHLAVRTVPLDPSPLYAWWIVFRANDRHPQLDRLLTQINDSRDHEVRGWLPEIERTDTHTRPPWV